jgi:hypothetical protein
VVEHLPSKQEALSSIPYTAREKNEGLVLAQRSKEVKIGNMVTLKSDVKHEQTFIWLKG